MRVFLAYYAGSPYNTGLPAGQSKNTFSLPIPTVTPYTALKNLFLAENSAWILWIPVVFGLGIITYFNLSSEPPLAYSVLGTGLCFGGCILLRRWQGAYWLTLYTLFFFAGLMAAQLRTINCHTTMLSKQTGPVNITASIASIEQTPHSYRIILSPISIEGFKKNEIPNRIRLNNVPSAASLHTGDTISANVILRPLPKAVVPGGHSFRRDAYFKQIGATGFALSPPTLLQPAITHTTSEHIEALRHVIIRQLFKHMPAPEAGIASALLVGDQGSIRPHDFDIMRDSGLAHLLAVSGMHLTQVAFMVFFLCRMMLASIPYLALHYPVKQWSAVLAILGSLGYLILTNMPVSATRAFIMTALILFAVLLDRKPTPMRSIALAALIILSTRPEAILSASFQMSFSAVIALVSCFELITTHVTISSSEKSFFHHLCHYLLMVIIASFIAGLATAPFTLYHFHQLSTMGVLANLVAIPLISFLIMPLALISLLAIALHLPSLPLYLLHHSIALLLAWADMVAHLPYASIRIFSITATGLALFCAGTLWLCLWQTKLRWAGLSGIIASLSVMLYTPNLPDVLIDEKGKMFAFRNHQNQLVFFPKKPSSYIQQQWQAASRTREVTDITHAASDPRIHCDILGCLIEKEGKHVAVSLHPLALFYDCYHADTVVNLTHTQIFCPKQAIHRWKLWKYGTHSVQIGAFIHIQAAEPTRASSKNRPWK